jgi:DNA-directed RNA polymerase specialized sigma24 family protein
VNDQKVIKTDKIEFYEQIREEKTEIRHLKQLFALYRSAVRGKGSVDSLELKEILLTIINSISELPPKSRQAIVLVCIGGLKPQKAADLIGCDYHTFRNRLSYSRKLIRKKMGKYMYCK